MEDVYSIAAPIVEAYYPISAFNSTLYPAFYALSTILTDQSFKCPAYRALNRAVEKGIPVWTYLFEHTLSCQWLPQLPAKAVPIVGGTNTAEIPFIFGNLDHLPGANGTCNLTAREMEISRVLINAYTSLASTGNASNSAFNWPEYKIAQSLGINVNSSVTTGVVDYSMCSFWDIIYDLQLYSIFGNNVTVGGTDGTINGDNVTVT